MRKILPVLIILILGLVLKGFSFAQIRPPYGGGLNTKVQGSIGQYYLSVSGFSSPNASISLVIDGVVIRTTTADAEGNFSVSQVLIKSGLTNFCLSSVDNASLGSSETCVNLTSSQSLDIKNLFLPPTLALSKSEISEGEDTKAYGYTMPQADVTLFLSDGTKLTGIADSKGYFSFVLKNLKKGKYTIYAVANYQGIDSLSPTKKLSVYVITKPEQVAKNTVSNIEDFWTKLWKIFTSWGLGILWIAIAIVILIIILIFKLWGDKFSSIFKLPSFPRFAFSIPLIGRKKHLHHYWLFGF